METPDMLGRKTLGFAAAILGAATLYLGISKFYQSWLLAHAEAKIQIFFEQSQPQPTESASELIERLDYIVHYYPSGTIQDSGSRIDRIVECARSMAIDRILLRLRITTNLDLGRDPNKWIEHFRSQERE